MPNQNKQEEWRSKLKNVRGYRFASPNSQKEIKSFIEQTLHQEREKAVNEKVEEIRNEIEVINGMNIENRDGTKTVLITKNDVLSLPSLLPTNNIKEK